MTNHPDFIGFGAHKAGTTWLYAMLEKHPDVFFPRRKELHFWDKAYPGGKTKIWYAKRFAVADKIRGDITPAYAILPRETLQEIYDFNPSVRLLYIMRNPIERSWSHAMMHFSRMEKLISLNLLRVQYEELSDDWFLRQFKSEGLLKRSDHATVLKNWLSVFDKDQLSLLEYEDISSNPRQVVKSCSEHIGLDFEYYESLGEDFFNQKVFTGKGMALRLTLVDYLLTFYKPKIDELSEFLGRDYSHWYKKYEEQSI